MKIYSIIRRQLLPITLQQAWRFFATPDNLTAITPARMNLRIVHQSGGTTMYPGKMIAYSLNVIPGVSTQWVSEITHVQEPGYFVDEQRLSPYSLWHHEHRFNEVPGGVEIVDEIQYALPWGILGRIAHRLFCPARAKCYF